MTTLLVILIFTNILLMLTLNGFIPHELNALHNTKKVKLLKKWGCILVALSFVFASSLILQLIIDWKFLVYPAIVILFGTVVTSPIRQAIIVPMIKANKNKNGIYVLFRISITLFAAAFYYLWVMHFWQDVTYFEWQTKLINFLKDLF